MKDEVKVVTRENRCSNLNHSRLNPPVRFCSACGKVVNGNIDPKVCSEEEHAKSRRSQNKYCVNCGEQLIREG